MNQYKGLIFQHSKKGYDDKVKTTFYLVENETPFKSFSGYSFSVVKCTVNGKKFSTGNSYDKDFIDRIILEKEFSGRDGDWIIKLIRPAGDYNDIEAKQNDIGPLKNRINNLKATIEYSQKELAKAESELAKLLKV